MKRIKLTEKDLKKIIKEATLTAIDTLTKTETQPEENEMVVEMARINKRENGNCIFPYNSFNVHIWSNDHNPPHFHVESDEWNVSLLIESGEVLEIKNEGKNKQILNYIVKNAKDWLKQPCAILPTITNQENAMLQWEQLHD